MESISVVHGGQVLGKISYHAENNFASNALWLGLQNLVDENLSNWQKFRVTCQLIAALPRDKSFDFSFATFANDRVPAVIAFRLAGFRSAHFSTFIYNPRTDRPAAGEPLPEIKKEDLLQLVPEIKQGRLRNSARNAIRDFTLKNDMSLDEYMDFACETLVKAGVKDYRNQARDYAFIGEAMRRGQAKVMAVELKDKDPDPVTGLTKKTVRAAMVYTWADEDNSFKLARISYRRGRENSRATLPLVLYAMAEAKKRGMILDADGAQGQLDFYRRYGFEEHSRDDVTRTNLSAKLGPKIARLFQQAAGRC